MPYYFIYYFFHYLLLELLMKYFGIFSVNLQNPLRKMSSCNGTTVVTIVDERPDIISRTCKSSGMCHGFHWLIVIWPLYSCQTFDWLMCWGCSFLRQFLLFFLTKLLLWQQTLMNLMTKLRCQLFSKKDVSKSHLRMLA